MTKAILMDLAERLRLKQFDQQTTEAIVDILTFAVASDGRLADEEQDVLNSFLDVLNWRRDDISADEHAHERLTEYLQLSEDDLELAISDYCKDAAERISDEWLRDELYFFVARLADADSELDETEVRFVSTLAAAFGIFGERRAAIDLRIAED